MPEDLKALQNSLNLKSIEAEAARAPTLARIAQERTDDLATANGTIDDMKDANAAVKTAADAAKEAADAIKTAGADNVTAEMITALDTAVAAFATAVAALALPAVSE